MAWDVLSGAAKKAWDVLSRVTKTAWDVLSGWQIDVGCFVRGVKKWHGMFCPGMFCPTFFRLLYTCIIIELTVYWEPYDH